MILGVVFLKDIDVGFVNRVYNVIIGKVLWER